MALNILITGARGFIGSHLVQRLSTEYHVISFEGDVADAAAWAAMPHADVVIHLAAVSSISLVEQQQARAQEVNIGGTRNAVQYCLRNNAALIFASTNVYGVPDHLPVAEDAPLRPANLYAEMKLEGERIIAESGVRSVILRLSNVYGSGQQPLYIIPTILSQLKAVREGRQDAVLLGNPDPKRDYLYIDDAATAFARAVEYAGAHEGCIALNIGSGRSVSVREIVEVIQGYAGAFPVHYAPTKHAAGVPDIWFNIAKAEKVLGWKPLIPLPEGLSRTVRLSL